MRPLREDLPKSEKNLFSLFKRGIILQATENIDVLDKLKDNGYET
jgi:hypothetical protein